MLTRRTFLLLAAALPLPLPALAQHNSPEAVIAAIYKRVSAGKGESGGQFVWVSEKDRPRWLSDGLVKLWHEADARTEEGDQGPMGFDPITNSQDAKVREVKIAVERQDAQSAVVAASFRGWGGPNARATVRYDMLRERGRWVIDDIRGATDGAEWSVRALLLAHMG